MNTVDRRAAIPAPSNATSLRLLLSHGLGTERSFASVCLGRTRQRWIRAARQFWIRPDENIFADGKGCASPANEQTHTYVNAYPWRADGIDNYFDRLKGTLTTKPKTFTWQCLKVGGQKF